MVTILLISVTELDILLGNVHPMKEVVVGAESIVEVVDETVIRFGHREIVSFIYCFLSH